MLNLFHYTEKEDISILIDHFISKMNRTRGKNITGTDHETLEILMGHDYPGNIRELENIIERSVALEASNIVLPDSLTLSSFKQTQVRPRSDTVSLTLPQEGIDLDNVLGHLEQNLLQQALDRTRGAKQKAAELLGISFRSFRYRLAKYGLAGEDDESEE